MSETARFAHKMVRHQLRVWEIGGAVLVFGLAVVVVLWAIVSGRDLVAVIGDALTFLTLLAALIALKYARDSATAALDTVQPMETMAADLAAAAETMKANLLHAQWSSQEERLYEGMRR